MTFSLNRRRFGQLAFGAAALAALKTPALAQGARPRVVVIGGGPGGATVAKYVAKDSEGAVEVVLIDANARHTTCFFSNLYMGGMKTFEEITWTFDALRDKYGVKVIQALATDIDPEARTVALAGGGSVSYDKLVLAPGIDFKYDLYEGYDRYVAETAMPHAYQAGPQTKLLKAQLMAMEDGGTVIIAAPPNPFRCPPGPYERASMMAYYLKKEKPKSKVLILDPKNAHSKQALFREAWDRLYPGMVEWVPGDFTDGIQAVDAGAMTVTTGAGETFRGDVINMIPAQKAGAIARMADLTQGGDWVPIVPDTLQSRAHEDIHVLGDACANGDMPKSGFSANSQAKACAMAVRAALTDAPAFPPRFRNTCWSMVGDDNSVKVGASYKAGADKIEKVDGFVSQTGEDAGLRAQTAMEAVAWYDAITTDAWG